MIRKKTYLTLIGYDGERVTVSFRLPEGDKAAQAFHLIVLSTKRGNPYVGPDGKSLPVEQLDEVACEKYIAANRAMYLKMAGLVNVEITEGSVEGQIEDYEYHMVEVGSKIADILNFGIRAVKPDEKKPDEKQPAEPQAKEDLAQDPTE